jgi:ABC-type glycerol-3-phosphate transport system substrate-binding protein
LRSFLGVSLGSAVAGLLSACQSATPAAAPTAAPQPTTAPAPAATAKPAATTAPAAAATSAPVAAKPGNLAPAAIELWYQDWPPLTNVLQATQAAVQKAEPNVQVKLTPIPYEQLQQKLLPSIAAKQEPEVMFGYTSWLVAADITKLFLPVVPEVMTKDEASRLFYPSSLNEGLRGDQAYFAPFANGMGGSTFTYNADLLDKAGVDPKSVTQSWDGLVAAGKKLVQTDSGGNITRAGIGFSPYIATLWVSGIQQMGASYYDPATHKFNLTSPEALQVLKSIDDLLKVHKLDDITKEAPSHANMTGYAAADGFEKGLAAITNFGSWVVSGYEKTTPNFRAGILRMPYMGSAKQMIEVSHSAVFALSRKLADDKAKLAAGKVFLQTLFSPDTLGGMGDVYGGSILSPAVVRDPSMDKRRWGGLQKQYDTEVWPVAQFEQHHIADWAITIAWDSLLKVFKDSQPPEQVLKDLENQSNDLEAQAVERLGS